MARISSEAARILSQVATLLQGRLRRGDSDEAMGCFLAGASLADDKATLDSLLCVEDRKARAMVNKAIRELGLQFYLADDSADGYLDGLPPGLKADVQTWEAFLEALTALAVRALLLHHEPELSPSVGVGPLDDNRWVSAPLETLFADSEEGQIYIWPKMPIVSDYLDISCPIGGHAWCFLYHPGKGVVAGACRGRIPYDIGTRWMIGVRRTHYFNPRYQLPGWRHNRLRDFQIVFSSEVKSAEGQPELDGFQRFAFCALSFYAWPMRKRRALACTKSVSK